MLEHLKRHRRRYQLGLSVALLALIIAIVEPRRLIEDLRHAPYQWIVPWSMLYESLIVVFWAAGMHAILRRPGPVPLATLARCGFALQGLTLIIPGRLGDIGLIPLLKDFLTSSQTTAALIIDKLVTLCVATLLGIAGVAYVLGAGSALVCISGLIAGLIVIYALSKSSTLISRFGFFRELQLRARVFLSDVKGELLAGAGDVPGIAGNLAATLCRVLLSGISFTLILYWFDSSAPLWYIIMIQAMVQLAVIIPVTYMGIGLVETLNVQLLGRIGIEPSVILAASLATRAVQVSFYLILTALWLGTAKKT